MFPDNGPWGLVIHTAGRGDANRKIGCQWVRLSLRWHKTETGARGRYQWPDTFLDHYLQRGIRVLCVLSAERLNPLYKTDAKNKAVVIAAFTRWAGAAARHYRGKGIVWELGNEPECFPMGGYWNKPRIYTRAARKAAAAIKAADPKARVAALSTAWMDRGFITRSLEAGLLDDGTIDILSFHGYHRRNLMPESGLAEDVAWLRGLIRRHSPKGKKVIVIDSERGYAKVPFLTSKHWASWRNIVYSEAAQAAYLARHYLEEIHLGIEISVWYKDMRGEKAFSLWYGLETGRRGLRPMGHVYRNLAALLPDNPKTLRNGRYVVSLIDLPDKHSDPNGTLRVRSYLRTSKAGRRLIVAMWNPVEAFDGRILESRKRIGDNYYEAWRAVSEADEVEIPVRVRISRLKAADVRSFRLYDLAAKETLKAWKPLPTSPVEENGKLLSPVLKVGPLPTILVLDIASGSPCAVGQGSVHAGSTWEPIFHEESPRFMM